jgi:NAD(P)-dependent dehydrogenase (short-subunit alcohol dehydrogenase family)
MSVLDKFSLRGDTALVTGAGQGIGRTYAHALAEAGASVAIVDINEKKSRAVADEIEKIGCKSLAVVADVTNPKEVNRMIEKILDTWGKLTIGINNAGIGNWTSAEKITEEEWDKVMEVNLKGVFLCAQAEGRVMIPQKYGKIINTASMSATIVNRPQTQAIYNSSKAGVVQLTRSLATEWIRYGINVNSISPGYIYTALIDENEEVKKMVPFWVEHMPINRMGKVEDLEGAIVFLASRASDFMVGHDLIIDGGYTLW